jgi:hypothetical protein
MPNQRELREGGERTTGWLRRSNRFKVKAAVGLSEPSKHGAFERWAICTAAEGFQQQLSAGLMLISAISRATHPRAFRRKKKARARGRRTGKGSRPNRTEQASACCARYRRRQATCEDCDRRTALLERSALTWRRVLDRRRPAYDVVRVPRGRWLRSLWWASPHVCCL